MLKVACSGPGVSRTRNLLVTSPTLYQLDHCTHSGGSGEGRVGGCDGGRSGRDAMEAQIFDFILSNSDKSNFQLSMNFAVLLLTTDQ